MKRIFSILLIVVLVFLVVSGCSATDSKEAKYFIEVDGKEDYLEEDNEEVVELLELIEAYEKVENNYDYKTADKTLRYPYITEEMKNKKETGRWESDIKDGEICMKWCSFDMNYIKFNQSFTEAELDYDTCFIVEECGCMGDEGFVDGARYQAPISVQAKKIDGSWKVDDYTFTSKNARRIDKQ